MGLKFTLAEYILKGIISMKEKIPLAEPADVKSRLLKVLSPRVHPFVQLIVLQEGYAVEVPKEQSSCEDACAEPESKAERAAPPSRPAVRSALESVVARPLRLILSM